MSIHTGPGRPVRASYSAFSRWNRISIGSVTITAYLVIGRTRSTMLISCTPSVRNPGCPVIVCFWNTWPLIVIVGTWSSHAPATPVIAFVPPGPEVTTARPRPVRTRA
jgi:hypothetical protein